MPGCVFCGIVAGSVSATVVYDDLATLAFMDRRQPNQDHGGHVLIVPKRHVEIIYDLDDETGARLIATTVKIARAMRSSFAPDGLSIWQSNGDAVGQEVPHVHFHVLARAADDGLLRVYPDKPPYPDAEVREQLAIRLRAGLEQIS